MRITKLIMLACCLIMTMTIFAQDPAPTPEAAAPTAATPAEAPAAASVAEAPQEMEKGFFFKLGEKVMNLGGFSYLAMEKKFTEAHKNYGGCLTEIAQIKFKMEKSNADLMACNAATAPAVPALETPVSP